MACPWLIKRFIDKGAGFIFVPGERVLAEAARLRAIPYDVQGAALGHHGQECSFDAFIARYGPGGDAALALLARIVNGADTDNSGTRPSRWACRPSPKASATWA